MSRTRDVVVVSLEAWDEVWRRNQYLVGGLLDREPRARVLFVEPPADPLFDATQRRQPRLGRGLRRVPSPPGTGTLWLFQPTKLLPRALDPRADQRLARATTRAAARVGMTSPVLWVNDPDGASVLLATGWQAFYDITDDWLMADRSDDEHRRLVRDEHTLLRRCAEVVVCSPALARSKGAERPVTLISNAVDVERYARATTRPDDLPEGRVALYLGTVHPDRFDVELAVRTGDEMSRTGGALVLVGPVVDLSGGQLAALHEAGVVSLGPRPRDAVPSYLQHADVLVVPHVVSDFTESLDPIKLYEYLAVGRPVVSTPVAGFREATAPTIRIAEGAEFADLVVRLAAQNVPTDKEVRRQAPTWRDRTELIIAVLDRVAGHPATPP